MSAHAGTSEPVCRVRAHLHQAEAVEDDVDRTRVGVQCPTEDQRRHHHGRGPGGDQRGARGAPEREPLVEELCEREREHERHADDRHHPDHRPEYDSGQRRLMPQFAVVAPAGTADNESVRGDVLERSLDQDDHGPEHDDGDQGDRRSDPQQGPQRERDPHTSGGSVGQSGLLGGHCGLADGGTGGQAGPAGRGREAGR